MNKKVVLSFLCGAALASTACAMKRVDGRALFEHTKADLLYHEQVCDDDGTTQLHEAVSQGKKELLPLLLQIYDVNVTNNFGNTPLYCAARKNNVEMLEVLLDAGAKVNVKNRRGTTLLFGLISPSSDQKIVALNDSCRTKITSQEQAHKTRLEAIVARMVREGVSVDELCEEASMHTRTLIFMTPLHYAIEKCNVFMVRSLLALGADCRILNGADFDAPSWARVLVTNGSLRRDDLITTRKLILEIVRDHVLSRPAN
jgi:ankyrin repeat protein